MDMPEVFFLTVSHKSYMWRFCSESVSGLFDPTLPCCMPTFSVRIFLSFSNMIYHFLSIPCSYSCHVFCRVIIIGLVFSYLFISVRCFPALHQTPPFTHHRPLEFQRFHPTLDRAEALITVLSVHCWGLSRSDTSTHQTLMTFLRRSFLTAQKQRRWRLDRGQDPQPMVTHRCSCSN